MIEPFVLPRHSGFVITLDKVGALSITTEIVIVSAHCPAEGEKVYVPVVVLLIVLGDQVPDIPFVEVVGKAGTAAPEHIGPIGLNVGVTGGITVMGTVAVDEQPHALVTVRLYEVDVVGQAVGFIMLVAESPVDGVHAYVTVV